MRPSPCTTLRGGRGRAVLGLYDATEEAWNPRETRTGADGALYARVKRGQEGAMGAPLEAKFTRHAQAALAPYLTEVDGSPASRLGGADVAGRRRA